MGISQSSIRASILATNLQGCLLGGALGDMLGAPVEGIFSLAKIREQYGDKGITAPQPYVCSWQKVDQSGIGAITDDTTMQATTLAAMMVANSQPHLIHQAAWQGYINWGVRQEEGLRILPHLDLTVAWPDEIRPFWFCSGAGRGTIAALASGRMGSIENPLTYDTEVRGQRVTGPNEGCGGMMRVASLAFWPHAADKFRLGAENAAITNSAPNAYLAAGAICNMVESVANGLSLSDAFNVMTRRLRKEAEASMVLHTATSAWAAARKPVSLDAMDALPGKLGHSNKFMALPVLAQTMYALSAHEHHGLPFKETLTLAVSHSGDSDSVGAITGNVLGVKLKPAGLPQDWLGDLQMRYSLKQLAVKASSRLSL